MKINWGDSRAYPGFRPMVIGDLNLPGKPPGQRVDIQFVKALEQNTAFVPASGANAGLVASVLAPTTGTVAKVATAADLLKKVGAVAAPGQVANMAWQGMQLSNTMTYDQIVGTLVKNNFTEDFAQHIAPDILKAFKSTSSKVLFVAVAAGGAFWAIGNFLGWPWRKTLVLVAIGTLTVLSMFFVLCWAGILRC
jgi:hypothetical protein